MMRSGFGSPTDQRPRQILVPNAIILLKRDNPLPFVTQRLFAGALLRDRTAECEVIGFHLRQMIERCTAHGAQPVLLTYPFPILDVEAVQVELARTTEAELVAIRERFQSELRRRSREELLIPDGHCNDAGYALMGRMAAEMARKLLDG